MLTKQDVRGKAYVIEVLDLGSTLSGMRGWSSLEEITERYNKHARYCLNFRTIRRRLQVMCEDGCVEVCVARDIDPYENARTFFYRWIGWPEPYVERRHSR